MNQEVSSSAISATVVKGCLVVPIPADLAGEIESLRNVVLEGVRSRQVRSVVLDFSALQLLDTVEFAAVRDILNMVALLGARSVLSGLRPGVVAYLVWNDVDTHGLTFMRDLDEALSVIMAPREEPAAAAETEPVGDEAQ